MTDVPPDRLSVDPASPFYDEAALARGVGVPFRGRAGDVEEYCVSENWIRAAAGKALDRRGAPLVIKMSGTVEPYFLAPGAGNATGRGLISRACPAAAHVHFCRVAIRTTWPPGPRSRSDGQEGKIAPDQRRAVEILDLGEAEAERAARGSPASNSIETAAARRHPLGHLPVKVARRRLLDRMRRIGVVECDLPRRRASAPIRRALQTPHPRSDRARRRATARKSVWLG